MLSPQPRRTSPGPTVSLPVYQAALKVGRHLGCRCAHTGGRDPEDAFRHLDIFKTTHQSRMVHGS